MFTSEKLRTEPHEPEGCDEDHLLLGLREEGPASPVVREHPVASTVRVSIGYVASNMVHSHYCQRRNRKYGHCGLHQTICFCHRRSSTVSVREDGAVLNEMSTHEQRMAQAS